MELQFDLGDLVTVYSEDYFGLNGCVVMIDYDDEELPYAIAFGPDEYLLSINSKILRIEGGNIPLSNRHWYRNCEDWDWVREADLLPVAIESPVSECVLDLSLLGL